MQIDTDDQRIAALIVSAEAGERESQFQLGLAYESGDGIEADEKLAALWFKRAARQEHPEALLKYGHALFYGRGVGKDSTKAFTQYLRGANLGNLGCQFATGCAYEFGDGVDQDETMAEVWYRRGADLGSTDAMVNLGYMYQNGSGQLRKDMEQAAQLFRKAAGLGNAAAMKALGSLYMLSGDEEYDHDPLEAMYWFKKGAELGDAKCMCEYGRLLGWDYGITRNEKESIYWLRKGACILQDTWSAELIALMLNWTRPTDYEEVLYWTARYCLYDQDMQNAAVMMAEAYQSVGGADACSVALFWWDLAVARGIDYGEQNIEECLAAGGTRQRAREIFAERDLNDQDVINGLWIIPLNLEEPSIWWENFPVPQVVRQEMGETFEASGFPPVKTDKMERAEADLNGEPTGDSGSYAVSDSGSHASRDSGSYAASDSGSHAARDSGSHAARDSGSHAARDSGGHTASDSVRDFAPDWMPEWPDDEASDSAPHSLPDSTQVSQGFSPDPLAGLPAMQITQLPPGSVLAEKYLVEKVLGRGGMAVVFKAKHLLIDRPVAIKMMLPDVARDATTAQRFQREAQNASMLRHPNVITIYDYGQTAEGQPFIVMDYLEGLSLDDILEREGVLTLSRGLTLLTQVCDALSAAHHEGIVHRDIKPSNIMIEQRRGKEHVLLVDFGIAKSLGEQSEQQQKLTKTGEVFGSLIYMSPEQCMGKPLDARSDVYAFGCVFWEVFCGDSPFIGETVFETMTKHIYEDAPVMVAPKANPAQREEMNAVFQKCVAKRPEDRYQNMDEVKDALLAIP